MADVHETFRDRPGEMDTATPPWLRKPPERGPVVPPFATTAERYWRDRALQAEGREQALRETQDDLMDQLTQAQAEVELWKARCRDPLAELPAPDRRWEP